MLYLRIWICPPLKIGNDFRDLFIRIESSYILSEKILQSLKSHTEGRRQWSSALRNDRCYSTHGQPFRARINGCKESNLHISISVVDLVAISLISGRKVTELFDKNVKIGFDPLDEKEPWVGRLPGS